VPPSLARRDHFPRLFSPSLYPRPSFHSFHTAPSTPPRHNFTVHPARGPPSCPCSRPPPLPTPSFRISPEILPPGLDWIAFCPQHHHHSPLSSPRRSQARSSSTQSIVLIGLRPGLSPNRVDDNNHSARNRHTRPPPGSPSDRAAVLWCRRGRRHEVKRRSGQSGLPRSSVQTDAGNRLSRLPQPLLP
jgi:hypothetical protein